MLALTAEQRAVVQDRSARLCVDALAGTGKTETVAARVDSLINEGLAPEEICVLTFTRVAQKQVSTRLAVFGVRGVQVRTIHSLGYQLKNEHFPMFKQMSDSTSNLYISQAIAFAGGCYNDAALAFIKRVLTGSKSSQLLVPSSVNLTQEQIALAAGRYIELKKRDQLMDFIDLIAAAESVAQPTFTEVIVDESQDLSWRQFCLVEKLTKDRLVLVGDRHQSIFGFAGAEQDVLELDESWTRLPLTTSFRSGIEILNKADDLLGTSYSTKVAHQGQVIFRKKSSVEQVLIAAKKVDMVLGRTKRELETIAKRLEADGFTVHCSWRPKKPAQFDVAMATIHSAKGGEWNKVLIFGLDSESFAQTTLSTPEEKRLLYVAATRAKKQLVVLYENGLPYEWAQYHRK